MTELSENSLILRNRKSQSVDLWNAKCSGEGRERLQKQNEDMDASVCNMDITECDIEESLKKKRMAGHRHSNVVLHMWFVFVFIM